MFHIKNVEEKDVPAVKKLLTTTWLDTYGPFLSEEVIKETTTKWHDPKVLAKQAKEPTTHFKEAIDDSNQIVGLITARKVDQDTLRIGRLYVDPNNQRLGIGSALMEDLIKSYPEVKRIKLEVEEQN